jgi:hypothetical protein
LISSPDWTDPESITCPDRGRTAKPMACGPPSRSAKIKGRGGDRGTRYKVHRVACSPTKTLAQSDLRAAEATGSSAAAAPHRRRSLILDLYYGSASFRRGQQWRTRLIDRRYAISLSLSLFHSRLVLSTFIV